MTMQIAVRLPDDLVAFADDLVRSGRVSSRAAAVAMALDHERRRMRALRDVEILTAGGADTDMDSLADYAARAALDID